MTATAIAPRAIDSERYRSVMRHLPTGVAAVCSTDPVTGIQNGMVLFGYSGQRTADMSSGIRIEDVRWLCRYLGRVTDAQLREALRTSGGSIEDADSFAASLRDRIEQLSRASSGTSQP